MTNLVAQERKRFIANQKLIDMASNTDIHAKVCEIALDHIYVQHVFDYIEILDCDKDYIPAEITQTKSQIIDRLGVYEVWKSKLEYEFNVDTAHNLDIIIKDIKSEYLDLFEATENHIKRNLLNGNTDPKYTYDLAKVLDRTYITCNQDYSLLLDAKNRYRNKHFVSSQNQMSSKVDEICQDIQMLLGKIDHLVSDKEAWVTTLHNCFQNAKLELEIAFDRKDFSLKNKSTTQKKNGDI